MKDKLTNHDAADVGLAALLDAARQDAPLPTGFQEAVWRRIEHEEERPSSLDWLGALAVWILRPRHAAIGLACAMFLGGLIGLRQASINARVSAQARYLAAVDPFQPRR
jgi:hypothetical protein